VRASCGIEAELLPAVGSPPRKNTLPRSFPWTGASWIRLECWG